MKQIAIRPLDDDALARCGCCGADPQRRKALKAVAGAALLAGAGLRPAQAADEGPRTGDWLVLADDDAKKPLGSADVKLGDKPVIAYPYDPAAKAVRDGTRMNRILLVRLDPGSLDGATGPRAAEGVVAYSAFCTHMGCDVNSWVAAEKVLLCYCHFSKFDPSQEAAVTAGPAPRPLPALPIKLEDGKFVIAGAFSAPPGKAA